jgi:alkaline phosphatase
MGDSEITSARYYAYGAGGSLPGIDALPLTGEATTYSLIEDPGKPDHGKPNYVPDSAATGTAWSTGHKTSNGRISTTIEDKSLPTILEKAKAVGFATGNVSTAEITDATPAVLDSHVNDRGCQGPADRCWGSSTRGT